MAETEPAEGTLNRALWRAQQMVDLDHAPNEDADVRLGDALADLMHWAADQEVNFEAALLAAQRSHERELEDWIEQV